MAVLLLIEHKLEMVEVVTWKAQYRETQHVEVYCYGLAYTLRNAD